METFEQYSLINQKKWTTLLTGLSAGEYVFSLPSLADIKSCKSVAYALNTDKRGKVYSLLADKDNLTLTITVKIL